MKPTTARSFALLAGLSFVLAACTTAGTPQTVVTVTKAGGTTSVVTSPASSSTSPSPTRTKKPGKPVHVKLLNEDGAQYGVGMPIIAFFSMHIRNAKAFSAATKVTAGGHPVNGAWYFETSAYYKGYPIEAHYRPQNYWPAHTHVHMDLPVKGLFAGKNMAFDDSLTLDFNTGARNISTVDDGSHTITVTSDGKTFGRFPTSLGYHNTPTKNGIKVIMEKGKDISMTGPGYYDPHVQFTQRLTYDGEYLHSAPWNVYNIEHGVDSSNGCTNLLPADAQKLYNFLEVGDVVMYPNANGPKMQLGSGYGDWNVPWSEWQTGGLVATT